MKEQKPSYEELENRITELTQAKEQAQIKEKEFRSLVQHSPDIIYKFSNQRGGLFWSDRVKDILGFTPEAIISHPFIWMDSIHPDDKESVVLFINEYMQDQSKNSIEYRIKTKCGKWIWLQDTFIFKTHIKDEIIIDGHAADITYKKKAEQTLIESEERLKLYLNSTSDVVFTLDTQQKHTGVYGAWVKQTGKSETDFIGKKAKDILKSNSDIHEKANEKALSGERVIYEWSSLNQDNIYHCQTSLSPLYENGEVTGLIGVGRNITELKQKEQELKDSEERWKFALEGAQDGVWDWNIENQKVYFSPRWKAMLGYQVHEITDDFEEWERRVHPDDINKCMDDIKRHIIGKSPFYSSEYRIMCKNGRYKWILDRGRIVSVDNNGKPTRMIGTHTDFTERIEIEKQLEKLNTTKDKLFSIIAHDLRSPFNSILGLSQLLGDNLDHFTTNESEDLLRAISSSAKNTLILLNNLLTWAKTQSGQIDFKPQALKIAPIFKEVITLLKSTAKLKNISLCYEDIENIEAYSDPNILTSILQNLISNAIKFTNSGGKISLNATTHEKHIEITVTDTGVGMDKVTLEKLFRLDINHTTNGTANEKGSGLGLVLCKEFVQKHGGKIWAESTLEKGSDFKFTLPLKEYAFSY